MYLLKLREVPRADTADETVVVRRGNRLGRCAGLGPRRKHRGGRQRGRQREPNTLPGKGVERERGITDRELTLADRMDGPLHGGASNTDLGAVSRDIDAEFGREPLVECASLGGGLADDAQRGCPWVVEPVGPTPRRLG